MNNPIPPITNTKFVEIVKTYWAWRRLWMATTIAFSGIGLVYVLFLKSDTWTAAQGLIVRDEANGAVMRLGRFQSQTEMKAAQETILEMARNSQVLREALLDVGPEAGWFGAVSISKNWPSQSEVTALADHAISVRAPQGAEFGTTEVIYLDVKQKTGERALELNRAVCKALDNRLRLVRIARADGVIEELTRATAMTEEELRLATEQLQVIEREAGADLSDLRGLSEANGNGSTSRQMLDTVKTELRQIENQHIQLLTDRNLLGETQRDPEQLLSAPASILTAHPGLKKLREGLADAQLNSSQLRGRFTTSHPLVYVALTSEKEIKSQLQGELALALATTEKDVENSQKRIDNLRRQQRQLEERLERLARIRADHDNLNNEVRARIRIHQDAEKQLADARASRDAALSSSLLTPLDEPVLGERPAGPGRSTIFLGMTVAGLFFGLGIVFLLTPLDGNTSQSDRWNEKLGRRISDRFPWLADADANVNAPRRRRSDLQRPPATAAGFPMTPSALSAMTPGAASAMASSAMASSAMASSAMAAIVMPPPQAQAVASPLPTAPNTTMPQRPRPVQQSAAARPVAPRAPASAQPAGDSRSSAGQPPAAQQRSPAATKVVQSSLAPPNVAQLNARQLKAMQLNAAQPTTEQTRVASARPAPANAAQGQPAPQGDARSMAKPMDVRGTRPTSFPAPTATQGESDNSSSPRLV